MGLESEGWDEAPVVRRAHRCLRLLRFIALNDTTLAWSFMRAPGARGSVPDVLRPWSELLSPWSRSGSTSCSPPIRRSYDEVGRRHRGGGSFFGVAVHGAEHFVQ
jgi:hypothetical protein